MKRFFLFFLMVFISTVVTSQVTEAEFQALKAFYNATNGNNWKNRTGWENINTTAVAADVNDSWHGVTVSNGHVIELGMYSNNNSGYLPRQIGDLKWLKYLSVHNCQLEGRIPGEIGNLVDLEGITMNNCQLSGPLPSSMANLTKLKYLYLSYNPLNCPFPSEFLKHWPKLYYLDVKRCGFTGSLPDIFDLCPDLYTINLGENKLTGEVPPSISKLSKLYALYLDRNQFSGSLPALEDCLELVCLYLDENNFHGTVPESWGELPKISIVSLYRNQLSGPLPAKLMNRSFNFISICVNYFTFEAVEPYIATIRAAVNNQYAVQNKFPLTHAMVQVNEGEKLILSASDLSVYALGGNNNRYKWFHNNKEVYSGNDPAITISSASTSEAGIYRFEVINTVVTDMTLVSEDLPVTVLTPGNHAPTDISLSPSSVNENQKEAFKLSVTDQDFGDLRYFVLTRGDGVNDRHNHCFSITGDWLSLVSPADYEETPVLRFLVTVCDLKGGSFTKAMEIQVLDVEEGPEFIGQTLSTTIDETAPNGFTVFYLTARDPGNLPVTYSIESGNENGAFGIDDDKLVVSDNSKLNYDQHSSYTLKVKASNGNYSSTVTLNISLSKINKMPVVEDAVFTIPENSKAGTVVGSITATDPEGGALSFTIISGNHDDAFTLSDNKLVVKNVFAIDYELYSQFRLVVAVFDGISHVPASVTVHLTNLPDETLKDILSFTVAGMVSPVVIDVATRSVRVKVEDVDPAFLQADFTLSKGAVSQPVSGSMVNLSQPLTIRVTSEVGVGADWTVYLSIPSPASFSLSPSLDVYPNPAEDEIHVSGIPPSSVVSLGDATGRILLTISNPGPSEVISLRSCRPGLCFLIVDSSEGRSVSKIIRK